MSKIVYANLTIVSLIVFLLGFFLYSNIIYPAYMSHVANCNTDWKEIYEENNRIVVAQVIMNTSTKEYKINVVNESYYDETAKKHEQIHIHQLEYGSAWGCDHKFFNILNEVEAYTGENLPNFIFNRIYS